MTRLRLLVCLTVVAGLGATAASAEAASTVAYDDGVLFVIADNVGSNVHVRHEDNADWTVADTTGVGVDPGLPECADGGAVITCNGLVLDVAAVAFLGGTGNDVVSLGYDQDYGHWAFVEWTLAAGGPGNDTLLGSARQDELEGGAGNDFIDGFSAADVLTGGGETVDLGAGQQPGQDTLFGGLGEDVLSDGEEDSDAGHAQHDSDVLQGGACNSPYPACTAAGADDAHDELDFTADGSVARDDDLSVDLEGNGAPQGAAGENNVLGGIQDVTTDAGDDVVRGTSVPNTIVTGDGSDRISGRGDADQLDAGPGADGTEADPIDGGPGLDLILPGSVGKTFGEQLPDGDDWISDTDAGTVFYFGRKDPVLVDFGAGVAGAYSGPQSSPTLIEHDHLNNIREAYGTDSNDVFRGGPGSQYVNDEGGDDLINVRDGDGLDGGICFAGIDRVIRDPDDSSFSLCEFISSDPPVLPTGLTGTATPGGVILNWDDMPESEAYVVARRSAVGLYDFTSPLARVAGSGYTATGLPAGAAACFKVAGVNDLGRGAESSETCATPLPVPGGGLPQNPPSGGGTTKPVGPSFADIVRDIRSALRGGAKKLTRTRLATFLTKGAVVSGRTPVAGTVTYKLVSRSVPRRGYVISTVKRRVRAGRFSVRLKASARVQRALKKSRRLGATLSVRFDGGPGRRHTSSAALTLRR